MAGRGGGIRKRAAKRRPKNETVQQTLDRLRFDGQYDEDMVEGYLRTTTVTVDGEGLPPEASKDVSLLFSYSITASACLALCLET